MEVEARRSVNILAHLLCASIFKNERSIDLERIRVCVDVLSQVLKCNNSFQSHAKEISIMLHATTGSIIVINVGFV